MKIIFKNHKRSWFLLVLLIPVVAVLINAFLFNKKQLLIAPMIGGLDSCLFRKQELIKDTPNFEMTKLCIKDESSPSQLIEATLNNISKNAPQNDNYKLGYTLYVPLLKLFNTQSPDYQINQEAVRRVVKSIEHVDRSVILYLFSDHFGVGSPLEDALAKNPDNLLQSAKGVMDKDKYYSVNIYPWSFVNTHNEITRLREKAFHAVLDEVCRLPRSAQKRVEGVTMLGELHHMFPDFQGGMGFAGDYLVSDYSQHSVEGFRKFLAGKFKTVAKLNQHLGSSYSNFEEVSPPRKNIRTDALNNYWEHIDAYAQGTLPVSGWVARSPKTPTVQDWVHIYNNGSFLARVPVAFGRQDVLAAHPGLASADVGWAYDLKYSNLPPGLHRVDIYLERGADPLLHLASRQLAIMDKSQATPKPVESKPLPAASESPEGVLFHVDAPGDLSSYYFNPMAVLWNDFRKYQVSQYISHFANIAKSKCIDSKRIYSHQILPFVNPGWDESKFGVGRDLAVPADVRLGVSLYGEASYGTSFFDWFKTTARTEYGITEFHPLKKMSATELNAVFEQHFKNNAQFLSFFVEGAGLDEDPTNKPNLFSFDQKNKNAGSDVLFQSVKEVLK
jgi:hypothetical protein